MADTTERDVMSYDEARYLDVQTDKSDVAEEQIELMNVGVTSIEETSNPTEKSVQYVGDKSKTNTVTGYDNQFAIESNLIKNNKVIEYLFDVFRQRKTGRDAQQNYYIVELWNPVEDSPENTKYKARKIMTTAVIESKTDTAGENITFSGTLKGVGDFIYGQFDTSTKTFTPDSGAMSLQQKAATFNMASSSSTTSTK